jgi:hypothetical protein
MRGTSQQTSIFHGHAPWNSSRVVYKGSRDLRGPLGLLRLRLKLTIAHSLVSLFFLIFPVSGGWRNWEFQLTVSLCGGQGDQAGERPSYSQGVYTGRKPLDCGSIRDVSGARRE